MKITKEAIYTETDSIASKLAGLTDAVFNAPDEWPEQSKSTEPQEKGWVTEALNNLKNSPDQSWKEDPWADPQEWESLGMGGSMEIHGDKRSIDFVSKLITEKWNRDRSDFLYRVYGEVFTDIEDCPKEDHILKLYHWLYDNDMLKESE